MRNVVKAAFASAVISLVAYASAGAQTKPLPKTISAGILNGKATSLAKPMYPEELRGSGLGGSVSVQVLIDESGKVISAKTVSGLENPSLRQAAEAAAMLSTFSPTLLSGQPVKVSGTITYNFVTESSNAERLKLLGISTFLTIAKKLAAEPETLDKMFEGTDMFADGAVAFPQFAGEFKSLVGMKKLPLARRLELIDKALASIHSKTSGSDRWQYDLGSEFGELLAPIMQAAAKSDDGEPDLSQMDGSAVRLRLGKIKQLLQSVPGDFPVDVLNGFKELAAFADTDDWSKPEKLTEVMGKLMALMDTISPEPK